jgi:hypothetical protein
LSFLFQAIRDLINIKNWNSFVVCLKYFRNYRKIFSIFKKKIMKILYFVSIGFGILFSLSIEAQPHPVSQKTVAPKQTMSSASDSLKMALNDAKTSFNTLFKGHRDTTTIMISDIDYEDSNLNVLKESLKKLKGVKAMSMEYKSSTIFLKVPYKGKPTDLWDQLPYPVKTPFKLVEANENNLILKFKNGGAIKE